jgi:hypothetical protein
MALVNLQTDLTSLTYGHDRPGGGSSNQPYIQTAIPTGDLPPDSPDFLLRNGFLAPVSAARDTSRLTQMFFDFKSPNGLLFTAKENLLSRISVKTEATKGVAYVGGALNQGVYLPTSTIAQALVGFTGTHLNLLGLDPTSLTEGSIRNYEEVIKENQLNPNEDWITTQKKNRLIRLNSLIVNGESDKGLAGAGFTLNSGGANSIDIISYKGGPNSIEGIGSTNIKFATTNDLSPLKTNYSNEPFLTGKLKTNYLTWDSKNIEGFTTPSLATQQDFRVKLLSKLEPDSVSGRKKSTFMSLAPSYHQADKKTIDGGPTSRINYVSPGQKGNVLNYTKGKYLAYSSTPLPVDQINAFPIYQSENVINNDIKNDLVKFRIAAINNNLDPESQKFKKDYMHFRAYIDAFSDAYNGSWDALKYMGRGENFYKYGGFNRTINLAFTVAAQSKEELIPMYKKLNFLASNLAPSYSSNGYMAGSLVELTMGGWCYELPGFITAMTLDVPQESTWEIGINTEGESDSTVKELPHIVKVTGFSFTPIERFRPSKQDLTFTGKSEVVEYWSGESTEVKFPSKYGDERYIALQAGNNNYDIIP